MSRSHKKNPICKQTNTKGMKRLANKIIRQKNKDDMRKGKEPISKGSGYKKEFCSYDVCDWKFKDCVGMSKKEIQKAKKDNYWRKNYYAK